MRSSHINEEPDVRVREKLPEHNQLWRGLMVSAHHGPQSRVTQGGTLVCVGPQAGNNSVWFMQLGEQSRHKMLGLGPQGLGLATGLMAPSRWFGVPDAYCTIT